ncbi:MAG TPA: TIGR01777 family oxidoreductase [Opitutaceae bacterium]|nr:TIGR01777 family oxidoreductase [Opitutaceae bacterium]
MTDVRPLKIVIAGASGFIGQALVAKLRAGGHDVFRLVRNVTDAPDAIAWNPAQRQLDPSALQGADVVMNLAGENIGAGRWTAERRERILRSRVDATATIAEALARMTRPPAALINASAAGFYGDRGDEILDESSPIGQGLLPEVCLAWETHAERAAKLGVRTVILRFGVVLAPQGGALQRMLPWFRLGLGGRLGDGRQWMSWIDREDAISAIEFLMMSPGCSGAFNLVAPAPVTNAIFAAELAAAVHRPAVLPVPRWALRLALGRLADEALLASTRVVPKKLAAAGYTFRHPEIGPAITTMLGGTT